MKYLFLLLFFLPLFSFAQTNEQLLEGLWVKADAKMKDGSHMVDHAGCGMNFLKYNFTNDGLVNRSEDVLFNGFKLPYKLKGDTLVVGGTLFEVIGLTKDTLKLSYFVPGAEDAQLPVFSFAKVQQLNAPAKATFDVSLKDSVYQSTNLLFPQCKGGFGSLLSAIATRYDNGTIKASFVIDKKGRVKEYTILELDSVSKGFAKIVGNAFGDLDWLPARKNNNPINSIVQVTLKSGQSNMGGRIMNTLSIQYQFLPKPPYDKLDPDEAAEAQRLFKNGLNQLNGQNYEKSVESLSKCIQIDSIDLNAYYLRAMAYTALNKNKEACKDWAALAAFGQVAGAKKLAKFCKN